LITVHRPGCFLRGTDPKAQTLVRELGPDVPRDRTLLFLRPTNPWTGCPTPTPRPSPLSTLTAGIPQPCPFPGHRTRRTSFESDPEECGEVAWEVRLGIMLFQTSRTFRQEKGGQNVRNFTGSRTSPWHFVTSALSSVSCRGQARPISPQSQLRTGHPHPIKLNPRPHFHATLRLGKARYLS
jgi:hypothetical protein